MYKANLSSQLDHLCFVTSVQITWNVGEIHLRRFCTHGNWIAHLNLFIFWATTGCATYLTGSFTTGKQKCFIVWQVKVVHDLLHKGEKHWQKWHVPHITDLLSTLLANALFPIFQTCMHTYTYLHTHTHKKHTQSVSQYQTLNTLLDFREQAAITTLFTMHMSLWQKVVI